MNNSTNLCHENADCIDNIGSYKCLCKNGLTGNGTFCSGSLTFLC